jgi:fibronectin-binding autotransporter adhesin
LWKFGDATGTETWTVNAGNSIILAGAAPTIEVVTSTAALNCVLAGTAGLDKTGAGALILTASNTFTGGTTLLNGTLTLNNANAIGTGALTIGSASNPILRNDSGSALTLPNNNMTWAGNFRHGGNGLNFGTGNVSITANANQEITSGTLTIGGVVSGRQGINKLGSGTLVLNGLNTFTGQTNLRQGALAINTLRNYGAASSLGAPSSTSVVIASTNSSTLSYTGTGDTTNRPVQVGGVATGAVTASIANNGTGPLTFTATAFNTPVAMTGGAARVLALGGSFGNATTPNQILGVIADNTLNGATAPANQVSLTKNGAGAWKLSGANTYTGSSSITAGTLILGVSHVLPNTTNVSISAATLDADTRTDTAGTLDVTGAATIRFGAGGALAFADSSAIDWTSGTLTLTGTFVSGSSLRFGTSASGLTTTQLGKISAAGVISFTLNASGYLTANTAPTFATWQTANGTVGAFNADHDNDGVPNGIEWFLGGGGNTTGHTALPGVVNTGGTLSVTWVKASTYSGTYGTDFVVESAATLGGAWTPQTLGVSVTIVGNAVTYTFPAPLGAQRFVRLRVTGS